MSVAQIDTLLATIPEVTIRQPQGSGLMVALLKAFNHATVPLLLNEEQRTPANINAELRALAEHLDPRYLIAPPFGSPRTDHLVTQFHAIGQAISASNTALAALPPAELNGLLIRIADKIRHATASIDFELAAIRADPGTDL